MKIVGKVRELWSKGQNLFSRKENYLMSHSDDGKSLLFDGLPERIRRKLMCDNMHLNGCVDYTLENGFPKMKACNPLNLDVEWYSYVERRKHVDGAWGVHFFLNDYEFLDAITKKLELTTMRLKDCDILMAPDCSLYVDAPVFFNKQNVFRSRFAGAYWQSVGFDVIQTASWGGADSLKYCFEGLAENSVTAVCGIGHDHCVSARKLWNYAVSQLVEMKSPTKLIVYGGNRSKMPDFGVPMIYINDTITKYFRR